MRGLYLVTDQRFLKGRSLEDMVMEAVKGGVSCVQLREKSASTRDFVDLAIALKKRLSPLGVPLIINDRMDVALAARADGVHIGQSDMPYELAREILGPGPVIGLSVESWEDVVRAQGLDVDYLGVSPVFATPTKNDTKVPWGLDGLARIRKYSSHPLVAIGGIDRQNAGAVIRAGAHALAVVSAVCGAPDACMAAVELCETIKQEEEKFI